MEMNDIVESNIYIYYSILPKLDIQAEFPLGSLLDRLTNWGETYIGNNDRYKNWWIDLESGEWKKYIQDVTDDIYWEFTYKIYFRSHEDMYQFMLTWY